MALALAGQCMPTFWLGILLILVFAVNLRWVPVYGGDGWLTIVLPDRDPRRLGHGPDRAHHALEHARGAEPGLPPDGAGEGHRASGR